MSAELYAIVAMVLAGIAGGAGACAGIAAGGWLAIRRHRID